MKANQQRLMCILAHPDDESLGMGGVLAKYASEGVRVSIVMATNGQRGRFGTATERPGFDEVGLARKRELLRAAEVLGVEKVEFLDYMDGELDQVSPTEIISKISRCIRAEKPQVVLTFGPEGGYGHPDHIAISQFATAAIVRAAAERGGLPAHAVQKLYYLAWPPAKWAVYQAAFKTLAFHVDGVMRVATPYPDWAITTCINASSHWRKAWQAIMCHETQMAVYSHLHQLSEQQMLELWGRQEFYRAFSLVNGGRQVETDLFEGIEPSNFYNESSSNHLGAAV